MVGANAGSIYMNMLLGKFYFLLAPKVCGCLETSSWLQSRLISPHRLSRCPSGCSLQRLPHPYLAVTELYKVTQAARCADGSRRSMLLNKRCAAALAIQRLISATEYAGQVPEALKAAAGLAVECRVHTCVARPVILRT